LAVTFTAETESYSFARIEILIRLANPCVA
jgi:hypothetical protein